MFLYIYAGRKLFMSFKTIEIFLSQLSFSTHLTATVKWSDSVNIKRRSCRAPLYCFLPTVIQLYIVVLLKFIAYWGSESCTLCRAPGSITALVRLLCVYSSYSYYSFYKLICYILLTMETKCIMPKSNQCHPYQSPGVSWSPSSKDFVIQTFPTSCQMVQLNNN